MNRCPNDSYTWKSPKETNTKNQIGRKFSAIFDKLLNPGYYEGTPYGQNFNKIDSYGISRIYVKDPLEEKLESFCELKSSTINYLVGFTGIGKTTLLRNFFKIQDRDVKIDHDRLIIYISFYYANLNVEHPQSSVEDEIVKYISRAISLIGAEYLKTLKDENEFWDGFYDFIYQNKPISLQNEDITPNLVLSDLFVQSFGKSIAQKKDLLRKACERNRLDYHSSMLKYLLIKTGKIHTVFFIFDDIESKEGIYHRPVVETARHLQSCFSCIEGNSILVKSIVALRAYTFRSNIDRQLEARREQIENNTIFKMEPVELSEIFDARFNELQEALGTEEKAKEKEAYDEAVKQVRIVSEQISTSYSSILVNLANYNLCNALIMFNSILTNVRWIAKYESEITGGFQVSADSYKLTAKTVFNALACGNEVTYSDKYNNFFPNLLHNGKEEGEELINLLILRYLIRKGATDLYGETYVQRSDIIQEISNVFTNATDSLIKMEHWQERVTASLNYLYDSGILLRSIYDIENLHADQIQRKYSRAFKFYVSPRGLYLYNLFSQNALLLELYRDSIYVDLKGNDQLTSEMRTYDVMQYLIDYLTKLFDYEKRIIGDALLNLQRYQDFFGPELLVSPLLEGLIKNINSYFKDYGSDYETLMQKTRTLTQEMRQYCDALHTAKNISFSFYEVPVKSNSTMKEQNKI